MGRLKRLGRSRVCQIATADGGLMRLLWAWLDWQGDRLCGVAGGSDAGLALQVLELARYAVPFSRVTQGGFFLGDIGPNLR